MRLKIKNQKLIVSKTNKPSGIEIVIQRKNKASFQEQTRLLDVFKFHPSGVLYKEETGIGATTLELRSLRNSIIVEPIKITASSKAIGQGLYVGSPTNLRTTQIYAKILDSKISSDMEKLKEKLN